MESDGLGYMGAVVQYVAALFFSLSALICFIYFYRKCGFEEDSKREMLKDE